MRDLKLGREIRARETRLALGLGPRTETPWTGSVHTRAQEGDHLMLPLNTDVPEIQNPATGAFHYMLDLDGLDGGPLG